MVVVVLEVAEVVVLLLLLVLDGLAALELLDVLAGLLLCAKQSPVRPRNNDAVTRYNFFISVLSVEIHFPYHSRRERPD
jgi:hypothetical protein